MGFRIGELTALQWKHIDYQNIKIKIEQAGSYIKEEVSFIKDTKNDPSERTVAFPNILINLLLEHKENQKLIRKLMDKEWFYKDSDHQDDFVFTQKDGKAIFIGTIPKWFKKFMKKNNLKHITFHGLRHTNTTTLLGKGINIVNIL